MGEIRTITFVHYEALSNGERIMTLASGDTGQGERLVERLEDGGNRLTCIEVCDIGDISIRSAFWNTPVLGPKPEHPTNL
jgi:hypothetical protein